MCSVLCVFGAMLVVMFFSHVFVTRGVFRLGDIFLVPLCQGRAVLMLFLVACCAIL